MDTPTEQAPAHEFPSWPMNCLNLYCHLANDYGRFLQKLGGAVDPAQTARAEGDYGLGVMQDVTIDRRSTSHTETFAIVAMLARGIRRMFSRIRSNTMIVS